MLINFNKKFNTKKYHSVIGQVFNLAIKKLKPDYKKLEVSVVFVDKRTIKKLNAKFRETNEVTDVLSFPFKMIDNADASCDITKNIEAGDINPETGNLNLGDIYLCLSVAKKQSKKYNHSSLREVAYLALHGLLHLFGYDHFDEKDKARMREQEENILSKLNINRDDKIKKIMVSIAKKD